MDDLSEEFFDRTIAVNLRHQMFAAQAVVPMMKAVGGGSIVNFGSVSWMIKSGELPSYAACKAAVHGMTRCLARDHRRRRDSRQYSGPRLGHDGEAVEAVGQ
ncbi:MAG: SDR family oxidoreductase [Micropruina sp.]|uniref:SDR family NAD(P)-dependent oxidoreductase n=1 Tax=Micropruina sp. TaxID=2737536 RepID=UPI0039E6EE4F